VVGLFAVAVGIATPAAAEWRRLDSPNFVVVGDVPARALTDVALKFEGFREALTRALTERPTSTPVPTVIVVFPTDKAFVPFKPVPHGKPVSMSGMFVARPDINYAAVVMDGKSDALAAVFHEYAHVVIANTTRNAPMWLSEGLAEYYSTYELGKNGREGVHGRALSHHLRRIQNTSPLKMEELMAVDRNSPLYTEKDRRSMFYAQSWALVHRMLRGEPPRTKELASYLDLVSGGAAPLAAWQQIFGKIDVPRELDEYVRRQSLPTGVHTLSERAAKLDAPDTPLGAADGEAFLAEFLLHMGRYDEATTRLSEAFKLDPASARLKVLAALLDVARGEHKKANEQLLSIGAPADWLVAYSAATAIAEIVARRSEPPDADQMEKARGLFDVVRKQRGEMANSMVRMATLEVKSAEGPTKDTRSAIERARLMAPGREDYVFIHAQVLAGLAEFASARTILGPLMAPAYPQEVRENARSLMSYILGLESEHQARTRASEQAAEPPPPVAGVEPSPSDAAARPADQSGLLYRELRVGEQRLEGMLERIECAANGSAIFHIRTADGITKASGRMSEVDFISYRDDLSSSIGCGPLKSPAAIYLTYLSDITKSIDKVALAIEFRPK
jgi:tetratricopeptide (TPR) repeat protein